MKRNKISSSSLRHRVCAHLYCPEERIKTFSNTDVFISSFTCLNGASSPRGSVGSLGHVGLEGSVGSLGSVGLELFFIPESALSSRS